MPARKTKKTALKKAVLKKQDVELTKINDLMMDCVVYYSGEHKTAVAKGSGEELSSSEIIRTGSELDYNPILPSSVLSSINPKPLNWDGAGKFGGI